MVGTNPYVPKHPDGPENQRTRAASCRPTLEFLDPPGFKKLFFVQSDLIDSSSIIGKRKKRCDIFLPINACCVESLQLSLEEIDSVASHFFSSYLQFDLISRKKWKTNHDTEKQYVVELIFLITLGQKNPKELFNGPDSELHMTLPYNFTENKILSSTLLLMIENCFRIREKSTSPN